MTEPRILAWDIETSPNLGYVWSLFKQNVALNQIKERGEVMSFAARWVDEPEENIMFFGGPKKSDRTRMIRAAHKLFDEADALVSWNGKGFDTRHMKREFLLADLTPPSPHKEIDLMLISRKQFRFVSNKLQNVSTELGLAGKVQHSGFDLWLRCMAGDADAWAEMQAYNEQDVHLLVDLYHRLLPWIGNEHPNRNLYDGLEGCPKCGADDSHLRPRGFLRTRTGAYQRYRCDQCGTWSSEGKRSFGTELR